MPSDTRARCPATSSPVVDGEPIELRCVYWGDGGRHAGDHLVHTPAVDSEHTWPNQEPTEADPA